MKQQEIENERAELTLAVEVDGTATVLVLHGNSSHNRGDMELARDFSRVGCNIFMALYRGTDVFMVGIDPIKWNADTERCVPSVMDYIWDTTFKRRLIMFSMISTSPKHPWVVSPSHKTWCTHTPSR